MSREILDSCTRTAGDIAGVFEYVDATGYFYLYETSESPSGKIMDWIHIVSGAPDFTAVDVSVRWDSSEEKVGLFIRDVLWAVFDCSQRRKYGGHYVAGESPKLPMLALVGFEQSIGD